MKLPSNKQLSAPVVWKNGYRFEYLLQKYSIRSSLSLMNRPLTGDNWQPVNGFCKMAQKLSTISQPTFLFKLFYSSKEGKYWDAYEPSFISSRWKSQVNPRQVDVHFTEHWNTSKLNKSTANFCCLRKSDTHIDTFSLFFILKTENTCTTSQGLEKF